MAADISHGTIITAPFSPEQVLRLNAFQESGRFHPFTCGWEHDEQVPLVATLHGWVCPRRCLYTQDWALVSMSYYPEQFEPYPLGPLESR